MCEYCGCQAIDVIADLTAEHDLIREAAEHLARVAARGDLAEARARGRHLRALLDPHTAVEEHGLFPAMAREFPEHVARLEAEHDVVEAALDETEQDAPAAGWQGRLTEAMRLLVRHAFAEQDGLFPAALVSLDPQDWEAARAVRAGRARARE